MNNLENLLSNPSTEKSEQVDKKNTLAQEEHTESKVNTLRYELREQLLNGLKEQLTKI